LRRQVRWVIGSIEKRIKTQHRANKETIAGIGVIGATAIAATIVDPRVFRSGRDFALDRAGAAAGFAGGKQKLGQARLPIR
jgi:transposase